MAAGTSPQRPQAAADQSGERLAEYDVYIEQRLRRTRRQVRAVAAGGALAVLATLGVVYLMTAAIVDHWVAQGGLGVGGRYVAFSLLAAWAAAFFFRRVAPLLVRPINSLYAAATIEQSTPGLKNSLINFLLLRGESRRLPGYVNEAVKGQAIRALFAAGDEAAVDCTPFVRRLMIFLAVLWLPGLYAFVSPKSPFTSFRRVLAPWAAVAAPTRVQIADVLPGDGKGFYERSVKVSARVARLREGETVRLVYAPAEGQNSQQEIRMRSAEDGQRFAALLPGGKRGFQQDLTYWIEAGDAASPRYVMRVESAPAIEVEEIEYVFPAYTEFPPRRERSAGDLRALAGTRVTLFARANQPIGQAELDFDCDGRIDQTMKCRTLAAQTSFELDLDPGTQRPRHESYQLLFRNRSGDANPEPIRHRIEIVRDLPPEVRLVQPALDVERPLIVERGAPLRFSIEAADPDFKLASLRFHVRRRSQDDLVENLLAGTHVRRFEGEFVFDASVTSLGPGESFEVWVAAEDNRLPKPNRAETPHYRICLAAASYESPFADGDGADRLRQIREPHRVAVRPQAAAREGESQEAPPPSRQANSVNPGGREVAGRLSPQAPPTDLIAEDSRRNDLKIATAVQKINQYFDEKARGELPKGDFQKSGPPARAPNAVEPPVAEQAAAETPDRRSPTEQMSEGGPQAENLEQSTSGRKQDGLEATARQTSDNQGDDSSTSAAAAKDGGPRSSGGIQRNKSKPDRGDSPSTDVKPNQAKPPRRILRLEGGQSGESEKRESSGDDDRPGRKVEPTRGDDPQPPDLAKPSTGDASGQKHHGDASHRRGGLSGEESSRRQPQRQMPDGVSGKGEQRPKNEAAAEEPDELKAKLGDDMPKNADGLKPPKPGQGENVRGSGDPNEKENKTSKENFDDYKGGDPYSNDKGDAGAGEQGSNHQGSPPPRNGVSRVRDKKQISPDGKKPRYEDEPDSGALKPNQSDSKGGVKGDESGGGKSGGGQRAENQGTGAAGQNTASSQGGGQSDQVGGGPTSTAGGDRTKSNQPAGGKPSGEQGAGSTRQAGNTRRGGADNVQSTPATRPSGRADDAPLQIRQSELTEPRTPDSKLKPPKQPADERLAPRPSAASASVQPKARQDEPHEAQAGHQSGGSHSPGGGGPPGPENPLTGATATDTSEPGGEEANLACTLQAVVLAVERLEDELDNERPDPELLARLGWTPQDAGRFVERWRQLERQARLSGAEGDIAREQINAAVESLYLHERAVTLSGEEKGPDQDRDLRERRRAPPPAEYAEQWREFNRGVAQDRLTKPRPAERLPSSQPSRPE